MQIKRTLKKNYALRRTAMEFGHQFSQEVPKILLENFYVDDCLKSVATEDQAISLVRDLKKLCSMGGFNLTKLVTNSRTVLNSVSKSDRSKQFNS